MGWDLSSLTRELNLAPAVEGQVLTTGHQGCPMTLSSINTTKKSAPASCEIRNNLHQISLVFFMKHFVSDFHDLPSLPSISLSSTT